MEFGGSSLSVSSLDSFDFNRVDIAFFQLEEKCLECLHPKQRSPVLW